MYVDAFAKINLYLDVLGRRPDGYHDLLMVTLPLELHDTLSVTLMPKSKDSYVTCDDIDLRVGRHNLVNRALDLLRQKCGFKENFAIDIHKEIPVRAGLAGGSSNAAATLRAVNTLLKLKLKPKEMNALARSVGADVPFCLKNVPALVSGVGEIIEPISIKKHYHVLIVMPAEGLSTKDVFLEADRRELRHSSPDDLLKALKEGDDDLLAASMFNALLDVSSSMVPEIRKIIDQLKADGVRAVSMSGSGSAVFALLTDRHRTQALARAYAKKGYDTIVTRILS